MRTSVLILYTTDHDGIRFILLSNDGGSIRMSDRDFVLCGEDDWEPVFFRSHIKNFTGKEWHEVHITIAMVSYGDLDDFIAEKTEGTMKEKRETIPFAKLDIGQRFEFIYPQSRLASWFTANTRVSEFEYYEREGGERHRVDNLGVEVYPIDTKTPLTHEELLAYGCEYCKAEDEHGDTLSGYWIPGDGNGKGYGHFLGETVEGAVQAIVG